jgi:hypothetical protein
MHLSKGAIHYRASESDFPRPPGLDRDFAVSCCCKPRRSIVAHRSTILPLRMRQNTMPVNVNARFVTGTGSIGSNPRCVPAQVARTGTRSPSATMSSILICRSGNAVCSMARYWITASGPGGRPRRHLVVPKIGRQLFSHRLSVLLVHQGFVVVRNESLVLLTSHQASPPWSRLYDVQAFGQSLPPRPSRRMRAHTETTSVRAIQQPGIFQARTSLLRIPR